MVPLATVSAAGLRSRTVLLTVTALPRVSGSGAQCVGCGWSTLAVTFMAVMAVQTCPAWVGGAIRTRDEVLRSQSPEPWLGNLLPNHGMFRLQPSKLGGSAAANTLQFAALAGLMSIGPSAVTRGIELSTVSQTARTIQLRGRRFAGTIDPLRF